MDLWDPNRSPETKAAIEHWGNIQLFHCLRDDNLEHIAHANDCYWDGWEWRGPKTPGPYPQSDLAAAILAWRRLGVDGPFR